MNLKSAILLVLFSYGCQQKHENKDVTQLRESLPQIEIPIRFNSDIRVKYKTVDLPENSLIKKLNERSAFSLIGKLFETESNITILGYTFGTIGTPILITFDNDGNEISRHVIFETANSELGHYTSNKASLLANKQLLFTDSTVIRKVNEAGTEEIAGSDSILLTYKKYSISDQGLIETIK